MGNSPEAVREPREVQLMVNGPCPATVPLWAFVCPGPGCFEIVEEPRKDRLREKENLQRGRCLAERVTPGPLFVSPDTWSESMNIVELDSQDREETELKWPATLQVPKCLARS